MLSLLFLSILNEVSKNTVVVVVVVRCVVGKSPILERDKKYISTADTFNFVFMFLDLEINKNKIETRERERES